MTNKKNKKNMFSTSVDTANKAIEKNTANIEIKPEDATESLLMLPVDKIHFDPEQPRKQWDEDKLTQLMASIEETKGCKQPVKVKAHPDKAGEYMLVFGEGRLRSHQGLKMTHIKAMFTTEEINEFDFRFEQLAENVNRADMTVFDKATAIKKLMELHDPKLNQKQVGEKLGLKATYVSRLMKILKSPPKIQNLSIENVTQNLNLLAYLSQLTSLLEEKEINKLIKKVKSGELSEKEAQQIITDINNPTNNKENKNDNNGIVFDNENENGKNDVQLDGLENEIQLDLNDTGEFNNDKKEDLDLNDNKKGSDKNGKNDALDANDNKPTSSNGFWTLDKIEVDPTDNTLLLYMEGFEEPLFMSQEDIKELKECL